MSRFAVLVLPFFIVSVISIEPLITNSSSGLTINNNQIFTDNAAIPTVELTSQNSPVLKHQEENKKGNAEKLTKKIIKVIITAYSSTPEETDESPFITASGSYVREGIVASNFLPFGTKIKIPEIFGEQIFVVEDRLHEKNSDRIDVWFPNKEKALKFGTKISEIEILPF